jgi:hypothetical protein
MDRDSSKGPGRRTQAAVKRIGPKVIVEPEALL